MTKYFLQFGSMFCHAVGVLGRRETLNYIYHELLLLSAGFEQIHHSGCGKQQPRMWKVEAGVPKLPGIQS